MFDGSRNDPFCTVLLEPVSEAIDVSTGSFPAKPDGLTYPLGTGPAQTQFARRSGRLHKAAISAGCGRKRSTSSGPARSGESPKAQEHSGLGALRLTNGDCRSDKWRRKKCC